MNQPCLSELHVHLSHVRLVVYLQEFSAALIKKYRTISTDPELVLSVVVKTRNCIRKLRSFV